MATATSHVRFDDLSSVFAAIHGSSRAVADLEEHCATQLGERLRGAGLRAVCRGSIPTSHGVPSTTIATSDAQVVSL